MKQVLIERLRHDETSFGPLCASARSLGEANRQLIAIIVAEVGRLISSLCFHRGGCTMNALNSYCNV